MSELIVCCNCGELSTFDNTIFINNIPTCPNCCDSAEYVPHASDQYDEKRD